MDLGGILPGGSEVEERKEAELPTFIPRAAVHEVHDEDDVDDLPRGAIAHVVNWDDELVLDVMVAGAAMILISREAHDALADHEDFEPDGFGVLDDAGLWLPGLDAAYTAKDDGWHA